MNQPATDFELPYGDILQPLLSSVFSSFRELCSGAHIEPPHRHINDEFAWLSKRRRGDDPQLFFSPIPDRSLRTRSMGDAGFPTRVSNLIWQAFERAEALSSRFHGAFLPSPLNILFDYLTDPSEPASRAYAYITLRTFLFQRLKMFPSGQIPDRGANAFSYQDIEDALSTIKTYVGGRDNIPLGGSRAKVLLCHLLAMKGLMQLRFGTLRDKRTIEPSVARLDYCVTEQVAPDDGYEFRLNDEVERLPQAAELINELWGVPIPIRGAETIFFGGLKFSSERGLVISVSGAPGTGKTSVALALAAVLAPMGARTYHVTSEEAAEDLQARLATLTPEYLRKLSAYPRQTHDWFRAERIAAYAAYSDPSVAQPGALLRSIVAQISRAVLRSGGKDSESPPLPCPLVVVLDGIHAHLAPRGMKVMPSYTMEELVADCRKLGALVILTSALSSSELKALDYLVDVVIELEYRKTESQAEKPLRVLLLRKTRHQLSRPGAHVCHLSGPEGLRISPQLSSQIDQRSNLVFGLPDDRYAIPVFNCVIRSEELEKIDHQDSQLRSFELDYTFPQFVDVFPFSHVLLHGRGSSGKSGLGLKILSAPLRPRGTAAVPRFLRRHRILVVSFLYPRSFYEGLRNRIVRLRTLEYGRGLRSPSRRVTMEVLHFLPGFTNPEDLFAEINMLLDKGDLEGQPFSGVMLDGLHNVFLQFPRLAENSMIWPMLFGMLRTRNVTVVTTHTTFSVSGEDRFVPRELMLEEARPLLHALVQASDFYFEIEPIKDPDNEQTSADYQVNVRAAVSQPVPQRSIYWNREKLVLHSGSRQRKLPLVTQPDA